MRVSIIAIAVFGMALAGCSGQPGATSAAHLSAALPPAAQGTSPRAAGAMLQPTSQIASLPDRGSLFVYGHDQPTLHRGASTWHPVQLSEAHALHAIAQGGMVVQGPDGQPIRLAYERHVEHADGNWSWIGRSSDGREGVLTFGEHAVYGSLPGDSAKALQVTTANGRSWVVETDESQLGDGASGPGGDFVVAAGLPHAPGALAETKIPMELADAIQPVAVDDASSARAAAAAPPMAAAPAQAAAAATPTTVDVLLGFTKGFADRLGGTSQAVTRLNFLVDLTNQAYVDSQVNAQIHVVKMMQVNYPDATANTTTLMALTGVNCTADNAGAVRLPEEGLDCTTAIVPAALRPLVAARETYAADVVALVRNYNYPENGSCGNAWLNGAGQTRIDYADAAYGFAVVSDSDGNTYPDSGNTCRQEYLAHELGHVMGLQHERATAQGTDDTNNDNKLLDPEEYGALPYAFGYNTDATHGDFYTIMSLRRNGQVGYKVFSNPRITTCGGRACGVTDLTDNARALAITMPIVASFRSPVAAGNADRVLLKDIDANGNGRSDLVFHNHALGRAYTWYMNGTARVGASTIAIGGAYTLVGSGDFNGDHKTDLLWTSAKRDIVISMSTGASYTTVTTPYVYGSSVQVLGVADVNGNGKADILLRSTSLGRLYTWFMNGATKTAYSSTAIAGSYDFVGSGDFNHDGRDDLAWTSSKRDILMSTSVGTNFSSALQGLTYSASYVLAGVTDVNGDGKADLLLRSRPLAKLVVWFMNGNTRTAFSSRTVSGAYDLVGKGDFNGDRLGDLLWADGNGRILMTFSNGSSFSDNPPPYTYAKASLLMDATL